MATVQPLDRDLQQKKTTLLEFSNLTERILNYLPNVVSSFKDKGKYRIYSSIIAGSEKFVRPLNTEMFIQDVSTFKIKFNEFQIIINKLRKKETPFTQTEKEIIDTVVYTIQQSIGAGLDLLANQNSARKHVGNRFEELIKAIFKEINISSKKTVLQIPYDTDEGKKIYKCENDLIISPYSHVKSTIHSLDENEIVVSIKTTSKDRMGKMFIDKLLLEKFVKHNQKVIGIFLNDVQRKDANNISYTLVSGLFMVYSKFLVELQGIYYIDPPPNANKEPYKTYMKQFSELLTDDLPLLLTT
ncbi:MAG: hypothetical protein U0T11_09605 [Chitinophagaceae bacterium]